MIQSLRFLFGALVVGAVAFLFLFLWMRTSPIVGLAIAAALGVLVLAISGVGSETRNARADQAWIEAAPDLPPHSERVTMEREQGSYQGPERRRAARGANPATSGEHRRAGDAQS